MIIKEIDANVFNEFASKHILKNFFQTKEYGELMTHSDFSVMYIGGYHEDLLIAGSLILYKSIGPNMKYGYAPRGFLIDYYDSELLKEFTKKIKEYFLLKKFAFIKINPEITYATLDYDKKSKLIVSRNKALIQELKSLGYDKLKDNLYFESLLPKYTPVIYLKKYNVDLLDRDLVQSVRNEELGGLRLISGDENDIEKFYSFIDDKENKTLAYYKYLYEIFKKSDMVDLIFVELNYDIYVKFLQKQYIYEQEKNDKINAEFNENPNDMSIYNRKMKSDQTMAKLSSDIVIANNKMNSKNSKEILGSAMIVKHQGRITIIMSGCKNDFEGIDVKTFLYFKIIEEYKKAGYLYLDLYGITGDFSDRNPFKELNKFKLQFKPTVYEYIGELDLIVNKPFHQLLWSTNKIQKEFYRPSIIVNKEKN